MQGFILSIIIILLFSLIPSNTSALCVKVQTANLRSGPGTKYEKTWQVFKYMPLKKIGSKGNWYKVKDVDGDVHWIYKKLVTNKYRCAVVKAREANIRKGPGTKYKKTDLSPAIKYDTFKVIKTKGDWVKVVDEFGEAGWIHKKLLWIQ
jgi:SH3-like domain-containing protein